MCSSFGGDTEAENVYGVTGEIVDHRLALLFLVHEREDVELGISRSFPDRLLASPSASINHRVVRRCCLFDF